MLLSPRSSLTLIYCDWPECALGRREHESNDNKDSRKPKGDFKDYSDISVISYKNNGGRNKVNYYINHHNYTTYICMCIFFSYPRDVCIVARAFVMAAITTRGEKK